MGQKANIYDCKVSCLFTLSQLTWPTLHARAIYLYVKDDSKNDRIIALDLFHGCSGWNSKRGAIIGQNHGCCGFSLSLSGCHFSGCHFSGNGCRFHIGCGF